jgi:hypothetical protein
MAVSRSDGDVRRCDEWIAIGDDGRLAAMDAWCTVSSSGS